MRTDDPRKDGCEVWLDDRVRRNMSWYGVEEEGSKRKSGRRARGGGAGNQAKRSKVNVSAGRERGRTPSSEATSDTSLAEKPMDAASPPDCRSCKRSLSALTGNGTDVNSVGTAKSKDKCGERASPQRGWNESSRERDPYFAWSWSAS